MVGKILEKQLVALFISSLIPETPTIDIKNHIEKGHIDKDHWLRCPHCGLRPKPSKTWRCSTCKSPTEDPFFGSYTGNCSSCKIFFEHIRCPGCERGSPYEAWFVD